MTHATRPWDDAAVPECEAAAGGELERLHRDLDVAVDKVARADGILQRVERMDRPPAAYLDLLQLVRDNLAEAQAWIRNTEAWIADHLDDCTTCAGAADALVERLESVYRPRTADCSYRLTLLEPAPVRLDALRAVRRGAPIADDVCGRQRCPLKSAHVADGAGMALRGSAGCLRAEQAWLCRCDGFSAELPGTLPLLDQIDPRAYLRRQLRVARGALQQGRAARVQFACSDGDLAPVFVHLTPDRRGRVDLRYSCDTADWRLLQAERVPLAALDPIALLEPFVTDYDASEQVLTPDGGVLPTHAQLAALCPRGSA
jgi:hypothetical protein